MKHDKAPRQEIVMPHSQYLRIETAAGGVFCSDREFIRAALGLLKPESRYARDLRELRHEWLRSGLHHKSQAWNQYCRVMG